MPSLFLKNFLRNFQKTLDKPLKICYNNYAEGEIHPYKIKNEREKKKMRTIEEIRAITQTTIEEREKESTKACTKIIEDVIEPNILTRAKKGFIRAHIDSRSLNSSQIDYIMGVYEEKGYKVEYRVVDDKIEIRWDEEE